MKTPDWEGFGRAILSDWPDQTPDDFGIQELAEKHGLLVLVEGGFNPEIHTDFWECAEPGDPLLELNFKQK